MESARPGLACELEETAHVSHRHRWDSDPAVLIVIIMMESGEYDVINDSDVPGITVM